MRDDDWEVWRRQWQGQPDEVVDLIRRVERETVQMRMGNLALLAPVLVASVFSVFVLVVRSIWGIFFAAGLWLIMGLAGRFLKRAQQGVWTPAAETTTAYLELSIKRCGRPLQDFRGSLWFSGFMTVFVLVGVYGLLHGLGVLRNAVAYWIVAASFLWTIAGMGFVMFVLHQSAKRRQSELDYLLDLQRRLRPVAADRN